MSIPYQKKEERDKAVARMLEVQIEMDGSGTDFDKLLKLEIKFDKLRQKYLDKLPLVNLNVCPFCGHVNKAKLDPWGIDGPFWASAYVGNRLGYGPDCCEHLYYYSGSFRYYIFEPTMSHFDTALSYGDQNKFSKEFFPYTSAFPFINGYETKAEDNPEFVVGAVKIEGGHSLFAVGCYTNPGRTTGYPLGKWFSKDVTEIGKGYWKRNKFFKLFAIKELINQKKVHWTTAEEDNAILHNGPFEDYPHPYPSESYIKDKRTGERTPL
jgi:hypothetical protein